MWEGGDRKLQFLVISSAKTMLTKEERGSKKPKNVLTSCMNGPYQ